MLKVVQQIEYALEKLCCKFGGNPCRIDWDIRQTNLYLNKIFACIKHKKYALKKEEEEEEEKKKTTCTGQ